MRDPTWQDASAQEAATEVLKIRFSLCSAVLKEVPLTKTAYLVLTASALGWLTCRVCSQEPAPFFVKEHSAFFDISQWVVLVQNSISLEENKFKSKQHLLMGQIIWLGVWHFSTVPFFHTALHYLHRKRKGSWTEHHWRWQRVREKEIIHSAVTK